MYLFALETDLKGREKTGRPVETIGSYSPFVTALNNPGQLREVSVSGLVN
jgi:hypothetical protein